MSEARPHGERSFKVELSPKSAIVALVAVAVAWLFLQLWQIIIVVVVGAMLVGLLNPFVARLEKRGIRRTYAIVIVFAVMFVVSGGFIALTFPRIAHQIASIAERLPELQETVAKKLEATSIGAPLAQSVRRFHHQDLGRRATELGLSYGPRVVEVLAYGAAALFFAFYVMIDRDRMRGALFALVPRRFHVRLSRVLLNLETIVGGYMRGQLVTSALMAVFTFLVLVVAGVPNALALAVFAGIADVFPYVGALLACGPATLAALSRGTTTAPVVLGLLAAYQEFESRVIVPRVYGRVLRLPPATVMIALMIGAKLLGVLGALLALPIAAAVRMMLDEMRVALPGDAVDDDHVRERDEKAEAEFQARAANAPAAKAAAIATEIAAEVHEDIAQEKEDPREVAREPLTSG